MSETHADRRIGIVANSNRVRVTFAGQVIADTRRALTLTEGSYPPVQYLPVADVDMKALTRTRHMTHCPHKGDAAYYSIAAAGRVAENAVWTYEHPHPTVAAIAGYVAFYPDRVDGIEQISA